MSNDGAPMTPDDNSTFDAPKRVAINRVYTRKGDDGSTSLVGGQRVSKGSLRIASYGEVDELNAFVGSARQTAVELGAAPGHERIARFDRVLRRVQHTLFNLGSILATLPEDVHPRQPRVRREDVDWLESEMDRCNADLEPLRSFVLPGGSRLNAELHVCRTVCRRVERTLFSLAEAEEVDAVSLAWVNRLSDAFFVWSRWANLVLCRPEELWEPNAASEDPDAAR